MDLIYEVNIEVEKNEVGTFRTWLKGHMDQVLATGCFEKAKAFLRESAPDQVGLTIHYLAKSEKSLEEYFAVHAPILRKDAESRFKGKFQISRRTLRAI